MKVIGIGDNVCDQYEHLMMMFPGGQAMNFSVYARMYGANSAYMGVFGDDAVAEHVIRTLDEFQIDRSHCRQYHGENGYARVTLDNGDRKFLFSNKGGVGRTYPLRLNASDLDYLRQFDLVHTTNNGHFNSQLPLLRPLGIRVSYDYSGRMWKDRLFLEETAPYIDYAFLSVADEEYEQALETARILLKEGCSVVVLTRGAAGETVLWDGHQVVHQPQAVKAVDTLGAGDSFATVFLLNLIQSGLTEENVLSAMIRGEQFAAEICMLNGAYGHGVPFEK